MNLDGSRMRPEGPGPLPTGRLAKLIEKQKIAEEVLQIIAREIERISLLQEEGHDSLELNQKLIDLRKLQGLSEEVLKVNERLQDFIYYSPDSYPSYGDPLNDVWTWDKGDYESESDSE